MIDRPVFIGEAPGSVNDPDTHRPLFPIPAGSAGGRLYRLSPVYREGLFAIHEYVEMADRINLLPEAPCAWGIVAARRAANNLWSSGLLRDRRVVLVGAKVRTAFFPHSYRWDCCEWNRTGSHRFRPPAAFAWIPHTSGRNLWYNDEKNRERVRRFLREMLVLPESQACGCSA